jgi:hypothetical protein
LLVICQKFAIFVKNFFSYEEVDFFCIVAIICSFVVCLW